jgi:hypothetical protein
MRALRILPEAADVKVAFKWMYAPAEDVILVAAGNGEYHADALHRSVRQHPFLDPVFEHWIRFIHLETTDFRPRAKKRLLCVRAYEAAAFPSVTQETLTAVVRGLGIKSPIVFGVTNASLAETTGDYLRKW